MLDALKTQIFLYTNGAITLRALREWFAPYSINPEAYGDPEFTRLAYEMVGEFADLDDGQLAENTLKMYLQKLAEPASSSPCIEIRLELGKGFSSLLPQTRSLIREAVPA